MHGAQQEGPARAVNSAGKKHFWAKLCRGAAVRHVL